MAQIRTPLPVKLFIGVLTSIPSLLPEVEDRLASMFGTVDLRSDLFAFDQTHYYDREMGSPIHRRFIGFSALIGPSEIAGIKVRTNSLEFTLAQEHNDILRPVNLDPGYLEQSKVVLASTKNFFHRILISDGIYGEVTLHYQARKWHNFPWTFPDYRLAEYQQFFSALRTLYRKQLSDAGFQIRKRGKDREPDGRRKC
jgi:hypothetical protein